MLTTNNIVKITGPLLVLALTACGNVDTPETNLSAAVAQYTDQASQEYQHAFVDLNDDGVDDAIVLLEGSGWCGSGGCTMLVLKGLELKGDEAGYSVVSKSSVTRAPVRISDSISEGWQNIIVYSSGADKLLQFDGSSYPSSPSMQSTATSEQLESATTVLSQP